MKVPWIYTVLEVVQDVRWLFLESTECQTEVVCYIRWLLHDSTEREQVSPRCPPLATRLRPTDTHGISSRGLWAISCSDMCELALQLDSVSFWPKIHFFTQPINERLFQHLSENETGMETYVNQFDICIYKPENYRNQINENSQHLFKLCFNDRHWELSTLHIMKVTSGKQTITVTDGKNKQTNKQPNKWSEWLDKKLNKKN